VDRARRDGDRQVLAVRGDIDLESSPHLWTGIRDLLTRGSDVWIELRQVDYIDSSGIAVLVQGHKHATRAGRSFVLLDPSPQVRNLIELAQLHRLFHIEQSGADEAR
jgi:anti-sigma B factor antagonist